jgi:CRP/FNR family transcriptional regulator, polysaccharide utilization system transcription regulator
MRKIECEHCVIRKSGVIQDLPVEELDAFHGCGVSSLYKPRQVIFHEDTPATGLYILCRGAVKLYQSDRFGRQYTLDIAAPGDVLGEIPADPGACYSTSAEALTDSQLCFLPRDSLVAFIRKHPMTGVRLLEAFSKTVSTARKRVRALALKRAESRLAELLMQLAHAGGEPLADGSTKLQLGYSRRELAEMIGVSPETAIRLLGRLKSKRAITTRRRELIITDSEKLARLANHESSNAQ